jgi:hypothetical protein
MSKHTITEFCDLLLCTVAIRTDIPSMVMKESSLWVSLHGNELYALVDRSQTTYGSTTTTDFLLTR